jgi:hypothetical protein
MDSRAADGSKSVLSAKRWFKGRNGTLTVVRIQRTYTRRAAKRSFKSGQAMVQVTKWALFPARCVRTLADRSSLWRPMAMAKSCPTASVRRNGRAYGAFRWSMPLVPHQRGPRARALPQVNLDEAMRLMQPVDPAGRVYS